MVRVMENIYIFGTGGTYRKNKDRIRKDIHIIGFLDNDTEKQGKLLDGKMVYPPEAISAAEFDFVFIMCYYPADIREQLIGLEIEESRIYDINRLHKILETEAPRVYGSIYGESEKIVAFSHSLTSTGAQNMLLQAAALMKKDGHDVVVISREDGRLRDAFLEEGIGIVISEDILADEDFLYGILKNASSVWVNTLWLYDIAIFLTEHQIRFFWWLHELSSACYVSRRQFRKIAMDDNAKVLSVGSYIDKNIHELYGKDIVLQRFLWGIYDYRRRGRTRHSAGRKMVLACIGGISSIKGQDIFVKAIDGMPGRIKNGLRCLIVGGGVLDRESMDMADRNPCIECLGEVDHSQMPELYRAIDGVVCCSRNDSMSVAVAEACMNEKFAIVSTGAGISELLVHHDTALIFENGNVEELRERIIWAAENRKEAEQIGKKARRVYDEFFSIPVFEERLRRYIT